MEIKDFTKNINKIVRYNDGRQNLDLILTACILRIYNNKFYYQAELTDKNNNSVVIVPLEKVEKV